MIEDSDATVDLPLTGMRVLDLAEGMALSVGRFLGDLGADVIRVEPPTGSASRRAEPMYAGTSLLHTVRNVNKRSIVLDPGRPSDQRTFQALVGRTDVLIEDSRPSGLESYGLLLASARAQHPSLVVLSLTAFGISGPYATWAGSEQVHAAMCGVLSRSGIPGQAPLLPPGALAIESAAAQAAYALLVAYWTRLTSGAGDHIDLSVFEAAAQVFDPMFGIAGSAAGGVTVSEGPRGRPDARHLYPIFRCADGMVRLAILAGRQWRGMFKWLGEPAALADPDLERLGPRYRARTQIREIIEAHFADKTQAELVEQAKAFGVPAAAVLSPGELLHLEHFKARNAFLPAPIASGETAQVTNGCLEVDGVRAGIHRPAPGRGEHSAEVLEELHAASVASLHGDPARRSPSPGRPFEGLRVLDLGVIVVGAETGRVLADLGAEVIKVENTAFPDGSRQTTRGEAMTLTFAWGHRNKQSLGLDLRSPRGREIFLDLVALSDVVLSNFKPGTMASLGLDDATLRARNPRIVTVESSAYGATGPWSRRLGYGPLVRAETGVTTLWKDPDSPDGFCDGSTVYPDHVAARLAAAATIAMLVRRLRTGVGGTLSLAQAEVILYQLGERIALESLVPGAVVAIGNHLGGDAPRGVYPCAGDDEWVVITIRDDADWTALAAVVASDLAADPRFASSSSRLDHREEIEAAVRQWTLSTPPRSAMVALQAVGVPAGMMSRAADLLADPQLHEREFFSVMAHPLINREFHGEARPALLASRPPDPDLRPAPVMGEQTREICEELLGMHASEVDELLAAGVLQVADPVAAG